MYGATRTVRKASHASATAVSELGAWSHTPHGSLALCTQSQVSGQKDIWEALVDLQALRAKVGIKLCRGFPLLLGSEVGPCPGYAAVMLRLCSCLATHQIPALTYGLISWPQAWWLSKDLPGGLGCHLTQRGGTGLLLVVPLPLQALSPRLAPSSLFSVEQPTLAASWHAGPESTVAHFQKQYIKMTHWQATAKFQTWHWSIRNFERKLRVNTSEVKGSVIIDVMGHVVHPSATLSNYPESHWYPLSHFLTVFCNLENTSRLMWDTAIAQSLR